MGRKVLLKLWKTFHCFTRVVSNRVYSLCHCQFNDLFIDSVRGWICFNKYTAVWQTVFGPTECFIRMDKIDWRGEGESRKESVDERASTFDKGNTQMGAWCGFSLILMFYDMPHLKWPLRELSCWWGKITIFLFHLLVHPAGPVSLPDSLCFYPTLLVLRCLYSYRFCLSLLKFSHPHPLSLSSFPACHEALTHPLMWIQYLSPC